MVKIIKKDVINEISNIKIINLIFNTNQVYSIPKVGNLLISLINDINYSNNCVLNTIIEELNFLHNSYKKIKDILSKESAYNHFDFLLCIIYYCFLEKVLNKNFENLFTYYDFFCYFLNLLILIESFKFFYSFYWDFSYYIYY